MIEVDLYNYWTKNLSFANLSKLKDYKVVYNIRIILIFILLAPFFLVLNLLVLFPILSLVMNLNGDVLAYFAIGNGLVIMSLLLGKTRFDVRRLVNRREEDVSMYELKENSLKNYIETKYVDKKEDATDFYRELIRLCEKKGNYDKLSMSVFYTLIGVVFALCAFLFDNVEGLEDRSLISYLALVVTFYAVLGYAVIKVRENQPKYAYSNLADALSRIAIKSRMKKWRE